MNNINRITGQYFTGINSTILFTILRQNDSLDHVQLSSK